MTKYGKKSLHYLFYKNKVCLWNIEKMKTNLEDNHVTLDQIPSMKQELTQPSPLMSIVPLLIALFSVYTSISSVIYSTDINSQLQEKEPDTQALQHFMGSLLDIQAVSLIALIVMILVIAVLLVKVRKLTALSEYERELIEKEKQKKTNNTTESPKHSDQE